MPHWVYENTCKQTWSGSVVLCCCSMLSALKWAVKSKCMCVCVWCLLLMRIDWFRCQCCPSLCQLATAALTHTHTLPGALKRSQFRLVVEWWGWHWYHHCHHRRSSAFCCCCFLTFLTGNHTHYQWQWLDVIGGGLQERVRRSAFRAEERFWEALRKEKERSCERAWRRRRLPSPSPSPPSPSIH